MAVVTRQLYGGAITCNVPQRFVDASELRAVPDNQEVFVDMSGDESAIIELLSMDASVPDMEAPVHYFNDLATHNDACSSAIAEVISPASTSLLPFIPAQNFCGVVVGHQVISKFKEKASAGNLVWIFLCLVRLRAVQTDILITLNCPTALSPESSSSLSTPALTSPEEAKAIFLHMLASFNVRDYSLFVNE